ncbi:Uncharacterised protein [Amycolatopsis camponoti]|uniref:Uncharacterized protein n=1 Tax=Amycolatopsis camponoti TaxID=2606593 RepID=A0A6I8LN28_9PSEU|nr:Uncharacterised protein [Amycolatopsis camponoti]
MIGEAPDQPFAEVRGSIEAGRTPDEGGPRPPGSGRGAVPPGAHGRARPSPVSRPTTSPRSTRKAASAAALEE